MTPSAFSQSLKSHAAVLKAGSSLLTDRQVMAMTAAQLDALARQIDECGIDPEPQPIAKVLRETPTGKRLRA